MLFNEWLKPSILLFYIKVSKRINWWKYVFQGAVISILIWRCTQTILIYHQWDRMLVLLHLPVYMIWFIVECTQPAKGKNRKKGFHDGIERIFYGANKIKIIVVKTWLIDLSVEKYHKLTCENNNPLYALALTGNTLWKEILGFTVAQKCEKTCQELQLVLQNHLFCISFYTFS